eukprot:Skav204348  [mRNA]  locus=scaffold3936:105494:108589:+ [translate_table: standard]
MHESRSVADVSSVTADTFDSVIQDAHFQNSRGHHQKLPRESGIFASIFGDKASALNNVASVCPVPPDQPQVSSTQGLSVDGPVSASVAVLKRQKVDAIFVGAIKSKSDRDYYAVADELWSRALKKRETILACTNYSGVVGEAVQTALSNFDEPAALIRDVMGNKSPRTINKRASTMLALFAWMDRCKLELWPLRPEHISAYDTSTVPTGKGSTKGRSLMEALRFCKHVKKLDGLDPILDNPILSGRVQRMDAARDTVKQGRPLTCDEVRHLENFLSEDHNTWDKYYVGCILYAIFSRSRWSDFASVDELELDVSQTELGPYGFIEGCTRVHKTGGAALKRAKQMPLVAPIHGITAKPWALLWFEVLKELDFPFNERPVGAVCRAPVTGKLGLCALSSEEISNFANQCLSLDGNKQVSSHCFKATTLTWSSKYGLEESARILLSHHELPSKSLACHSRDMLSRPLALYQGMLKNIRDGCFLPDESRSGRVLQETQPTAEPHVDELNPDHPDDVYPSPSHAPSSKNWEFPEKPALAANDEDQRGSADVPSWREREESPLREQLFHVGDTWGSLRSGDHLWSESFHPREDEGDGDDSNVEANDSSSDSSGSSSAHEEQLQRKHGDRMVDLDLSEPLYQHHKSRVLHRPNKAEGSLACGRRIGDGYTYLPQGSRAHLARTHTAVKRLVFEAQTLTIASLRSTVQSPEDSTVRKIAPAERTARLEAQRNRLQGLDLTGPLEPSHWLYDQFSAMLELGEIKYIAPNKCMTRQQEIAGENPDKQIKLDENKSSLVVKEHPKENETDVASDLALFAT